MITVWHSQLCWLLLRSAVRDVAGGQGLLRVPSLTMLGRVGENGIKSQIVPCETQAAFSHQAKLYQPGKICQCLLDQAFLFLMPS